MRRGNSAVPFKELGSSSAKQTEEIKEEKKDFSDKSKYKTVREGRTGGISQDIKSGKYYSTTFGHEMQSDTIRNPFDESMYDVKWTKKSEETDEQE